MKQLILFLLVLAPIFGREKILPEPKQIVSLSQLDSDWIKEWIGGLHPDMAVEFKPGTEIPLRFFHRAPLFSIAFAPNLAVRVEKLCYLRFVKKKVYISQDLVSWEKPSLGGETAEILLDSTGALVKTAAR